jgi:predicted enzyme related to lactoylglutathione lyase
VEPAHSQAEPPTLGEHSGYPVYPMPAFVSLAATDLAATVGFFTRALDFGVMFTGPERDGVPLLVHQRRARYQDVLVRQGPTSRPSTSLVMTFAAIDAAEIDALEARVRTASGSVISPAADTPWNTRELTVADPDGNHFAFTARAADYVPGEIETTIRRAADAG